MLNTLTELTSKLFENNHFFLACQIFVIIIKIYLITKLVVYGLKSKRKQDAWYWLLLFLVTSIPTTLSWCIELMKEVLIIENINIAIDPRISIFFIRFGFALGIIEHHSLGFFIESLVEKKVKITIRKILFLIPSIIITSTLLYFAFFTTHYTYDHSLRPEFEFTLLYFACIYVPIIIIFPNLLLSLYRLKKINIPKILRKQLKILIIGFILPILISEFIQVYPYFLDIKNVSNDFMGTISALLIAFGMLYCTKKILRLRFLNLHSHVEAHKKYSFINKFIDVLGQLSETINSQELIHITKNFFKDALTIPTGRTNLFIRQLDSNKPSNEYNNKDIRTEIVENFISEDDKVIDYLKQTKILIYDDIDFSNFYLENDPLKKSLTFLNKLNAEIFIPIYKNQTIIAYILIEREIRNDQIYNNLERDEMVVFSSYLGNIINLLQTKNLESLITKEKELKEELYLKHQEVNQYKESIRSFLKSNQHRKIGIIFYKNRKFTFANQDSKEIIPININLDQGHWLALELKKIVKQVEDYQAPQNNYSKDIQGNKVILSAMLNQENNNIIILTYYPDISDTVRQQLDLLKDPSKWDYLLYLETTKSGQLINQLIPGQTETLLNFKINLLKVAISREAILLQIPDEDLISIVEIINHISLRENLHILKLTAPTKNYDLAVKLFGINPIFEKIENNTKPILQKLDGNGTLFIENIHYLDIENQENLANFVKQGYFQIFKSDQKIFSDVRIICSTNANLKDLVHENKFSKNLYNELKNTLFMPSLLTLSENELSDIARAYSEQAVQANTFKNLLELTDKEKLNIVNKRPVSLQEFKVRVQQVLTEKTKKNNVHQETHFDPAYNVTDPKLIEAARLGKHALKDPKILSILWNKFKNQNKIATFLGVNRSSVHRRFKEYKIE